jgi:hypothetical protein
MYNGPRSICIKLRPEFYPLTLQAAIKRLPAYAHPMAAQNNYYTPLERLHRGMLCQLAFAYWLGEDWNLHAQRLYARPDYGRPDVRNYEIKFMGWRKPEHMDSMEGGNLLVASHSYARWQVGLTAFDATMRDRVFIEGFILTAEAKKFPLGFQSRGRAGRPHKVPHHALSDYPQRSLITYRLSKRSNGNYRELTGRHIAGFPPIPWA